MIGRHLRTCRSFAHFSGSVRTTDGSYKASLTWHALHRKQVPFHWTWEQEDAFNQLKQRLTSAPVLGTFYLDCDASDVGLGSVLSQEQGGSEVVIAYASRALSKPERNYDTTRRES